MNHHAERSVTAGPRLLKLSTYASVFGKVHLGYLVLETTKFSDWRRFGADAIGLHVDEVSPDAMRFRLDDRQCRFLLCRGPAEDVTAMGWHVDDDDTFDNIASRLKDRAVPVVEGTPDAAALRGVGRLLRFPGPKGIHQEVFTAPLAAASPLKMQTSAFVTGEAGIGHVAITSTKPGAIHAYYDTVFDARLTDWIEETISGMKLRIRFLRVNARHHSVAVANVRALPIDPVRTKIQHLNIEAANLDDVTSSYERVRALGFRMALGVGQHTNDRELSYYAVTPSGFEWEVGWKPIVVDESTWEPSTHQGISIWGHTPVRQTILDKLARFRTSATSLARDEIVVAELSEASR